MCQATGTPPGHKYEKDKGPGIEACLEVLAASQDAWEDRCAFAMAQLGFWLLAAPDGHAKNFSLHHRRGGRFGLTPLYDVLSAWPIIGDGANRIAYPKARLAMAVRGEKSAHYRLRDVQARHWQRLAASCGPGVWERMLQMARGVDGVLQEVEQTLPPGFPARTWEPVAAGMRRHAREFLRSAGPEPAFAAR